MVDQTGDTYRIAPILPACYDTVDMNAPEVLQPWAQLTVQWCTAVMTGALPQTMEGTGSLAGLVLRVPPTSIVAPGEEPEATYPVRTMLRLCRVAFSLTNREPNFVGRKLIQSSDSELATVSASR